MHTELQEAASEVVASMAMRIASLDKTLELLTQEMPEATMATREDK